jgi:transcriptional regulator with GAF, ATPase, and Fis domain
VPELSGSEFFGHEKGAFTGAVAARDGAFALANNGTFFLDEVGELPLTLQAELLRVVQEGAYKRIGSNTWQKTSFRLICATNRDLRKEEAEGRFRRDFYFRIAGRTCRLPPLRERREDVIPLAEHFWRQLRPDDDPLELDPGVRELLLTLEYPGNVRDLRRIVSDFAARHVGGGPVTLGSVAFEYRPTLPGAARDWRTTEFEDAIRGALNRGVGLKDIGRASEDVAVRLALADERNNLQRAAERLQVTDRALQLRRASERRANGRDERAD